MAADWMLMLHGFAFGMYDDQSGPRGDRRFLSANMVMGMAQHPVGAGTLGLRSMLSLEPATIGREGYPELLQTGETADGKTPLIDRQHPHDLFMELSTSYSLPLATQRSVFLYMGLPGEPALGPPTFMHRFSGSENPEAPLLHHWLDSTHITFGVVTAGVVVDNWKLEASAFRGREPDQFRYDIEAPKLDSFSARVSWNPVRELSIHMSNLGTVEADVVEDLLLEFVSRMSASGALMGNFDATERLLTQYLPSERVVGIMDEIRGPAGRNMWEKLSNVQEEVLANYLKNEYPQTIAVVLSKLKPEHAARVLAILPEDMALDVVGRMLRMEAVQKEVIERVESTLRTEFMSNLSQTRRRDAHEVMAEIFNNFDRQTETRFITSLEEEDREAAERIKALMFTFDDLIKLDSASAQTLMRNIDKDKLGVALKSANEEVRSFFLGNMSSRAGKMLLDDMAAMGPVRLRDVDEAQALLVNLAKDMAAKGEITLTKNRADDELVY